MNETIKTKLQRACEWQGLTFFFDTWNRANRSIEIEMRENDVYPAALMISTSAGAFQLLTSGTYRQEEIVLALFERTERDNTALDAEIQARMIEKAGALLIELPVHDLEVVGEQVRYSPFTDRLDENVAGIVLTMTLRDTTAEECKL